MSRATKPRTLLDEFDKTIRAMERTKRFRDDGAGLRKVHALLVAHKYKDAYKEFKSLDTFVREAVSDELLAVLHAGHDVPYHAKSADAAWRTLRRKELAELIPLRREALALLEAKLKAIEEADAKEGQP